MCVGELKWRESWLFTHYSNKVTKYCLSDCVARRKTLKAFAAGLNLGQPTDKRRGPRRNASSENGPGLHGGDLDSAGSQ